MRVLDICSRNVIGCRLNTNLATVGWMMWESDCGVVPVLDELGKVIGVITDRDICMAAATKHRPASEITVQEVCSGKVYTCRLNDEVRTALETMRTNCVRRLPVVDAEGKIQGLLSLNDVALAARAETRARPGEVTYADLALTLQAVCRHIALKKENAAQSRVAAAG